jgi:hypothetical protein
MEERIIECTENKIKEVLDADINTNNIEYLYKLSKIRHMAKEDECMRYNDYNDYGRRPGFNSYGDDYGRRGRDMKYRGYGHLDRMYDDYGRYEYGRERYGHNEDTKRSLKYMLESMEDFARMLKEDAQSQEEIEMIRQTAQRIAQM